MKVLIAISLVVALLCGGASASSNTKQCGYDMGFSYPSGFDCGTIKVDKGVAIGVPQPTFRDKAFDYNVSYVNSNPDSRAWKLTTASELVDVKLRSSVTVSFKTFLLEDGIKPMDLATNLYNEQGNIVQDEETDQKEKDGKEGEGTSNEKSASSEESDSTLTSNSYGGNEAYYYTTASWREGDSLTYKEKTEMNVWIYVKGGPQVLHIKIQSTYYCENGEDNGERERLLNLYSYVSDFIGTKVMAIDSNNPEGLLVNIGEKETSSSDT